MRTTFSLMKMLQVLSLISIAALAGALVLPARNAAENEIDFLRELPGEQEYYRTSTENYEFIATTFTGDGDDDLSSTTIEAELGSGDDGEHVPISRLPSLPSLPPPGDQLTYYFVRLNVDGEETNGTDRQWLEFLRSNGVDLTKIRDGNGNFGVMNLMPSADVGAHLIDDNSPINLTEDDMFKLVESVLNPGATAAANLDTDRPIEILQTPPDEVPMAVDAPTSKEIFDDNDNDDHLLLDQPQYELVNDTNLHKFDESSTEVDTSDVVPAHSGDGAIEDISMISRKNKNGGDDDEGGEAGSGDESSGEGPYHTTTRSTRTNNNNEKNKFHNNGDDDADDSLRIYHKTVQENKNIQSIIQRYKFLRGWSF